MHSDRTAGTRPDQAILGGRPPPQRWVPEMRSRLEGRFEGLILNLFALVPILAAFIALGRGRTEAVLLDVVAAALVIGASASIRAGRRAERAFRARSVARAPGLPRKAIGAACLGAAAFLLAFAGAGHSFMSGLAFGIGATVGGLLMYGLDPRGEKRAADHTGIDTDMFRTALDAAAARIAELDQIRRRIASRALAQRLGLVVGRAQGLVETIERQPDTFNRARKMLNLYLDETLTIARKFAGSGLDGGADPAIERKFTEALDAMETVMAEQQQKLLAADALDLDVQLEVLTRRLKSEGLH
ncbi:5-bromo-4-chloroindolyl phosphate hydrolysis family protein [Geminicoccus roseus]|uniref:5-bromo-4-chloroindolyl phosphate hydrolysis family protein n=1 Tax=Geminicoccus roseus TaxID=404900 RepID=UPI000403A0CB|nr:5-bromo-4-chloroindolyl phosphate hydrolysis family protein [Geminicoccus roseus]